MDLQKSITLSCSGDGDDGDCPHDNDDVDQDDDATAAVTDLRFLQAWKTTTETEEAEEDAHAEHGGQAE